MYVCVGLCVCVCACVYEHSAGECTGVPMCVCLLVCSYIPMFIDRAYAATSDGHKCLHIIV